MDPNRTDRRRHLLLRYYGLLQPKNRQNHQKPAPSSPPTLPARPPSATSLKTLSPPGIELKRAVDSAAFDLRLSALETRIASISETVQSMSTKITDEVMRRLSAPDGPLANQHLDLSAHTNKMERMYTMLLALTGNQQIITAEITPTDTSPNRTARKRDSTNDTNMADSCPSPPQKIDPPRRPCR
jgi:hypothetical protein